MTTFRVTASFSADDFRFLEGEKRGAGRRNRVTARTKPAARRRVPTITDLCLTGEVVVPGRDTRLQRCDVAVDGLDPAYHSSDLDAIGSLRLAHSTLSNDARRVARGAWRVGSSGHGVVSVVPVLRDHRLAVSAVRIAAGPARPSPWRSARRLCVQPADSGRPRNVAGLARPNDSILFQPSRSRPVRGIRTDPKSVARTLHGYA